jgi:ureidoacrylate peracid hydrolase
MMASVQLPASPEALNLELSSSALIVVDMQNAYASPGGYLDLAGFYDDVARLRPQRVDQRIIPTALGGW